MKFKCKFFLRYKSNVCTFNSTQKRLLMALVLHFPLKINFDCKKYLKHHVQIEPEKSCTFQLAISKKLDNYWGFYYFAKHQDHAQ